MAGRTLGQTVGETFHVLGGLREGGTLAGGLGAVTFDAEWRVLPSGATVLRCLACGMSTLLPADLLAEIATGLTIDHVCPPAGGG